MLLAVCKKIPAMGIEPILPREHDFESRASTNSATPAFCCCEGGGVSFSLPLLSKLFRLNFFELGHATSRDHLSDDIVALGIEAGVVRVDVLFIDPALGALGVSARREGLSKNERLEEEVERGGDV